MKNNCAPRRSTCNNAENEDSEEQTGDEGCAGNEPAWTSEYPQHLRQQNQIASDKGQCSELPVTATQACAGCLVQGQRCHLKLEDANNDSLHAHPCAFCQANQARLDYNQQIATQALLIASQEMVHRDLVYQTFTRLFQQQQDTLHMLQQSLTLLAEQYGQDNVQIPADGPSLQTCNFATKIARIVDPINFAVAAEEVEGNAGN
ncbi:hypothetical protein BC835DRAFT_1308353 [Cytidiella melzeri]|nr:hypothetical protein BC835DRAFT_1308353 [Cytidiella melzeri]